MEKFNVLDLLNSVATYFNLPKTKLVVFKHQWFLDNNNKTYQNFILLLLSVWKVSEGKRIFKIEPQCVDTFPLAKQTIILWLREYKPFKLNTLKKLKRYLLEF